MRITNNTPKKKRVHYNINGVPKFVDISPFSYNEIIEIINEDQLNLNSHDEAVKNYEEKFGINLNGGITINNQRATAQPLILSAYASSEISIEVLGNYSQYLGYSCVLSHFSGGSMFYNSTILIATYGAGDPGKGVPPTTQFSYRGNEQKDWSYISGDTLEQTALMNTDFNNCMISGDSTTTIQSGDTITLYGGTWRAETYEVVSSIYTAFFDWTIVVYNFPPHYDKITIQL